MTRLGSLVVRMTIFARVEVCYAIRCMIEVYFILADLFLRDDYHRRQHNLY